MSHFCDGVSHFCDCRSRILRGARFPTGDGYDCLWPATRETGDYGVSNERSGCLYNLLGVVIGRSDNRVVSLTREGVDYELPSMPTQGVAPAPD